MSVVVVNPVDKPVPVLLADGAEVSVSNDSMHPVPITADSPLLVTLAEPGQTAHHASIPTALSNRGGAVVAYPNVPSSVNRVFGQSYCQFSLALPTSALKRVAVGHATIFDFRPTATGVGALMAAIAPDSTRRTVRIWATVPSSGLPAYPVGTMYSLIFTEMDGAYTPAAAFGVESITANPWEAVSVTGSTVGLAQTSLDFTVTTTAASVVLGCAEYDVDAPPGTLAVTLVINVQEATTALLTPDFRFWVEVILY